jgi:hypothetical protein
MKRSISVAALTGLAVVVVPASAQATRYFVTKFEGAPKAKMAFAVRSGRVEDTFYASPMRCGKGDRDSVMYGEAKKATISDGRFASKTTYGASREAFARVRGRGFPDSPNGFFRSQFDSGKRICRSGRLSWNARQVTVDAWRKYRANQLGLVHG